MKKILACLIILGLIGLITIKIFKEKKVNAENLQLENLIKILFDERIDLLSSKNLDEFDKKLEKVKLSLTSLFINVETINNSLIELRELYCMAEGYNEFEIVSIVPLIRIYRIDTKENIAVSYVEQFILYRVKSKEDQIKTNIPKEWIVPNENGVWRAASSDYYTIILRKDLEQWRITEIIRSDYRNEDIRSLISFSVFAEPPIKNFSKPPKEIMPLPYNIENEINNFKVTISPKNYPGWMYREQAANYADNWWNKRNVPKYPSYSADCANFVSQCLYDNLGGRFMMDWYNNEIPEQPNSNPAVSQEWHIYLYSNYSPSYSWTWCPCQDSYSLYNYTWLQCGFIGYLTSYLNLAKGDIVYLDQNNNQVPDHVGIVVAFAPNGTPLVDAHTEDRYHVSWKYAQLYHCIHLNYEDGYHY